MNRQDIETAHRLLSRVCALLGGSDIHVQIHGVPMDAIAAVIMAGGSADRLGDGLQVAALEDGLVKLAAFGRQVRKPAPRAEENVHE